MSWDLSLGSLIVLDCLVLSTDLCLSYLSYLFLSPLIPEIRPEVSLVVRFRQCDLIPTDRDFLNKSRFSAIVGKLLNLSFSLSLSGLLRVHVVRCQPDLSFLPFAFPRYELPPWSIIFGMTLVLLRVQWPVYTALSAAPTACFC